jgi:hypothetical protein
VKRNLGKSLRRYAEHTGQNQPHLTADRTALPAGERKDFDVVCGELEDYPQNAVEVVGCSNVVSYG